MIVKRKAYPIRLFFLARPFLSTVFFLSLTFCLTSCGLEEKTNTLRLMIWGDVSELESVRSFVKGFETVHPEIKVKIFSVNPTDYNQHLQALYLNHQSPDVMYISREWLQFYSARGMIKDLQPFIQSDKEFDFNDFYPEVRNSFVLQNKPYAIAKDFTPLVLYYNEDLFKKSGVPLPTKQWKWENFLKAARKLTMDQDHDGRLDQYGFVIETWMGWVLPWVWQAGGEILDKTESKSLVGVAPYFEQNVRAIQFLHDLIYKERVAPDYKVTERFGTSSLFLSGQAAMCVYGRWMFLNFKKIKDFKWNVVPLPKDKNRSTALLTVGYAISSYTKQPKESWELIKHLTSIEEQSQVAESGLAVPSRRSVAQSPQFLNASTLPQIVDHRVFLESLEHARFPPAPLSWPELELEFNTTMNLIFRQSEPVNNSLLLFHEKLESILRKK